MYRFAERHAQYMAQVAVTSDGCPFCKLDDTTLNPHHRPIITQTEHALVAPSIYPYEMWEDFKVAEHLLLLPKRHVGMMSELTPAERTDIMNLCCDFGSRGYNIYNRALNNVMRTVEHIHIHLIKTVGGHAKHIEFTRAPYDLKVEW